MTITLQELSLAIKQLEWSEERQPCWECGYNHVVATSPFGQWRIEWKGWKENPSFYLVLQDLPMQTEAMQSLDDAKAAAQSMFVGKVLQCLEVKK